MAAHLLSALTQATPGEVLSSVSLAAGPGTDPAHGRPGLPHFGTAGLVRSQPGANGGSGRLPIPRRSTWLRSDWR